MRCKFFSFFVGMFFLSYGFIALNPFAFAAEEQITLTTFYPSPNGVYDKLGVNKLAVDVAGVAVASEFAAMQNGDAHIGRSLIVGAGGGSGFAYDEGVVLGDGSVVIKSQLGIGTTTPSNTLHVHGRGSTASLALDAGDNTVSKQATLNLITLGNGALSLGNPATRGWHITGRGSAYATATEQNDLGIWYWDGAVWQTTVYADSLTRSVGIGTPVPYAWAALDVNTTGTKCIHTMDSAAGGLLIGYAGSNIQARTTAEANTQNLILQQWGGNVGIGTASPGQKLDVTGTAQVDFLQVNSQDAVNEGGEIRLDGAGAYTDWRMDNFQGHYRLHHGGVEYLRVQSNGSVGIGTSAPANKLDVAGNISLSGWFIGPGGVYGGGGAMLDRGGDNGFSVNWTGAALQFFIENVNVKNFIIQHPLKEDKYLIHTTLEGPENAVFYRGEAQLINGRAEIMLPDYFEALVGESNRSVLLTPKFGNIEEAISSLATSDIKGGKFLVKAIDDKNPNQKFYWEVKAVRRDVSALFVEPDKNQVDVYGNGPYKYYSVKKK